VRLSVPGASSSINGRNISRNSAVGLRFAFIANTATIGVAVGLLIALPLPKIFGALFFDLHIHEPWVYFIVPIAILAVAILATYFPARRAARIQPMNALRQE
jgi:putative ABC transport system permease protein